MNQVNLIGRLGRDPEIKTITSGSKFASFAIAISKKTKDGESTDWIDCVAWGKTEETIEKYVKKGDRIGINGSLQTRTWEDANGNKRKVTEVLVFGIDFLSERKQSNTAKSPEPTSEEPRGELPFEV